MIVGIGELLWDVFSDGRKVAGGAPFNFAFHCQQLGHDAVIVSRVGDDDLGRELRDEVRRLGLSDEFIQTDREHSTGTVRVTVDEQGQPAYTITEDVAWDYIGEEGLPRRAVAVCYGTLAQRCPVSRSTIQEFVGPEMSAALRVFDVNLRHHYYGQSVLDAGARWCDWLKLSSEDASELAENLFHDPTTDTIQIARAICDDPEAWYTVIYTRGDYGCTVFDGYEEFAEPGVPARVVDTVGAGDAFTAAMVCLHLEGRPLRECARFANHYAARVCEHQGATPAIDRAEVERAAFGR
ncbi:MAG TPA: carbohydrate kinase [Fimbriiglobus sp.]|nr:carbohydrate kinase [Fimbriiglobus sp.]